MALALNQDRLVFQASRAHGTPKAAGLAEVEEIALATPDGERLVAWRKAAAAGRATVLYLHGNGGGLMHRARRIADWSADGTGVFALEWRGFGAATGAPSEAGLKIDAQAAYDLVTRSVPPRDLFIFGESLGAGVAVWLASRNRAAGLMLDSSYASVEDLAADQYWFFPVRLVFANAFPARDWIGAVTAPIFAAHGRDDTLIPLAEAEALLAHAPKNTVTFVTAAGGHIALDQPEAMAQARAWMAQARPSR